MYSNNHYNSRLKEYARELRTESVSRAEKYLWKAALSRKKTGERFLRQRPIENFIVDFFAPELKLIIEVDGSSHLHKSDYDRFRENRLNELGYELIRFSEGEVLSDIDKVITTIRHVIHCIRSREADGITLLYPPSSEEK